MIDQYDIRQMDEERYRSKIQFLEIQNQKLLNALTKISRGEGAYSRDELTHARNTIENMMKIANNAIKLIVDENIERNTTSTTKE